MSADTSADASADAKCRITLLQYYLTDTEKFALKNKMKINKNKTQVMIFNKSRKLDFPPDLEFTDGTKLEVISQIRLVGLVISDNLSWHDNTLYICRKARTKLWIIRRMKRLSLSNEQMFDVYCKEIRSIVEYGVPVWHPSLTKKDSIEIERWPLE